MYTSTHCAGKPPVGSLFILTGTTDSGIVKTLNNIKRREPLQIVGIHKAGSVCSSDGPLAG